MSINQFNINTGNEITEILPSTIEMKHFEEITQIIKKTFQKLGVETKDMMH